MEALLSQPSVSKPSVSSRMDFIKVSSERLAPPPSPPHLDGLFIVGAWRAERFWGSICPPGPRTAAPGVSWWLWGRWKGQTKRGRGPDQKRPPQTRQGLLLTN